MQTPFAHRAAESLRTRVTRRLFVPGAAALALCLVLPSASRAQQFVTDDAALTDFRACQLEAWHGESSSWILPACQPLRNLEITAGIGFIPETGARSTEYVLQGKALFRELTPNGVGIGAVVGAGFGPLTQIVGNGASDIFAHVPVSVSLADDRLILHGNLGWHLERDEHEHNGVVHDESHHTLTWAVRSDVLLRSFEPRARLRNRSHHSRD